MKKLGEWKIMVHDQYFVRFVVFAQPGKLCDIVGQLSKLHTYALDNASTMGTESHKSIKAKRIRGSA